MSEGQRAFHPSPRLIPYRPVLSVPFSISDNHSGLSALCGVVCLEGEEVVIEMEVKLLSLFKRPPRSFRFDVTDLEEVRHRRRFWGDTVTIRTRPLERVTEIPGAHDGALCLKVKRRDRPALDALLDRLELWLID